MGRRQTYRKEADKRLKSMLAIGQSKHADKVAGRETKDKIYSWETYHSYRKWADNFLDFCKEHGKPTDLASCKQYVDPWLQGMIARGLSAWTIGLAKATMTKLFGCPATDFMDTPKRMRSSIKRSRHDVIMDQRIKADWQPLIDFCKATGLRRHELTKLCGSDLCYVNGKPCLSVKGKGGRLRTAPIVGSDKAVQAVVDRCLAAGGGLVWSKVPKKLDIHSYRAEYAQAVYKVAERSLNKLKGHDIYYCRGDRKGMAYDREALKAVSLALGHNRISVVAENYLWSC